LVWCPVGLVLTVVSTRRIAYRFCVPSCCLRFVLFVCSRGHFVVHGFSWLFIAVGCYSVDAPRLRPFLLLLDSHPTVLRLWVTHFVIVMRLVRVVLVWVLVVRLVSYPLPCS
jgi:hypothetical protein